MPINTPLLCRKCDTITSVDMLVFRQRKQAGVVYTCKHCGANLCTEGTKPPKGFSDNQKRSREQEERMAKREGGRAQPGSGSVPGFEGDVVRRGKMRGEAKFTRAQSYTLKLVDLVKLENQARGDELPVFEIEFQHATQKKRFVVLPGWAYDTLMDESGRRDS